MYKPVIFPDDFLGTWLHSRCTGTEFAALQEHAYLWFSGTTLTLIRIAATPSVNIVGVIVSATIALLLGIYAWQPLGVTSRINA